jgi:hypothetical protein
MKAIVDLKLPLPWRTGGFQRFTLPGGWTIAAEGERRVRIEAPDAERLRLELLAELLALRTHGSYVLDGEKRAPKPPSDVKKLMKALAEPLAPAADAALVVEALSALEEKLDRKADAQGFRRVVDPKLRKILAEDADEDGEPAIKLEPPPGAARLKKVAKAFEAKAGAAMPAALEALFSRCDGITPRSRSTFGSTANVLDAADSDWLPLCLTEDGEGPSLLVVGDRALVVDVFHETPGDDHGSGWPVLETSFGRWLGAYLASGLDLPRMKAPFPGTTTPLLLEWSDAAIAEVLARDPARTLRRLRGLPEVDPIRPTNARGHAMRALEQGQLEEAIRLAVLAQTFAPDWPRATFTLASALARSGRADEARAALRDLLDRWLDDAPALPPEVHPRSIVQKDELTALVRETLGAAADALVARIAAAGEVDLPSGDFL